MTRRGATRSPSEHSDRWCHASNVETYELRNRRLHSSTRICGNRRPESPGDGEALRPSVPLSGVAEVAAQLAEQRVGALDPDYRRGRHAFVVADALGRVSRRCTCLDCLSMSHSHGHLSFSCPSGRRIAFPIAYLAWYEYPYCLVGFFG